MIHAIIMIQRVDYGKDGLISSKLFPFKFDY